MSRPDFIQSPTIEQTVSVYTLIRFGRKIVSQGNTFTPDDAVEFRRLMNRTSTAFDLPFGNDNDTAEQAAVRTVMEEHHG
jgi:hypothetical protein